MVLALGGAFPQLMTDDAWMPSSIPLDIPQIMCYDHFYQNKTTIPITSEIKLIILTLVLSMILVIL